jgi:hypothetical protein
MQWKRELRFNKIWSENSRLFRRKFVVPRWPWMVPWNVEERSMLLPRRVSAVIELMSVYFQDFVGKVRTISVLWTYLLSFCYDSSDNEVKGLGVNVERIWERKKWLEKTIMDFRFQQSAKILIVEQNISLNNQRSCSCCSYCNWYLKTKLIKSPVEKNANRGRWCFIMSYILAKWQTLNFGWCDDYQKIVWVHLKCLEYNKVLLHLAENYYHLHFIFWQRRVLLLKKHAVFSILPLMATTQQDFHVSYVM